MKKLFSERYPYPCCRCGLCCISEVCPSGRAYYKITGKQLPCPSLSFDSKRIASCSLAGLIVPVGDGCCIKARAFKDGKVFDFASMPPEFKRLAVKQILRRNRND